MIAYGWESASFYRKWYGGADSPDMRMAVNEMTGIHLNLGSRQFEIAPAVLELVRWVLNDSSYVDRIKRHYQLFRETIDSKHFRTHGELLKTIPTKTPRIPRRHRPHRTDNG